METVGLEHTPSSPPRWAIFCFSFTVFFFFFKQVVFFSNIFLSLLLFSDNFYMVLDLSMSVCKFSFSSLIINLSKAKILI